MEEQRSKIRIPQRLGEISIREDTSRTLHFPYSIIEPLPHEAMILRADSSKTNLSRKSGREARTQGVREVAEFLFLRFTKVTRRGELSMQVATVKSYQPVCRLSFPRWFSSAHWQERTRKRLPARQSSLNNEHVGKRASELEGLKEQSTESFIFVRGYERCPRLQTVDDKND